MALKRETDGSQAGKYSSAARCCIKGSRRRLSRIWFGYPSPDLNIRIGPGIDKDKTGKYTNKGIFTIVEEADGSGASGWGLLKAYQNSRDGWISLDHTERIK